MLASVIDVSHVGYAVLVLLVMAECSGVPIPGETALIAAGVLASQGKLKIELVIGLAALAAIVGDNIGYTISRNGGRWLLERPGRFQRQRLAVLAYGEPFFERHGPKAVFFGRFLLGLRIWASWLAGATRMRWRSFLFWNACGGIIWATAIGLIAYFLGHSAGSAIEAFGILGLAAVLGVAGTALFLHLRHRRRIAANWAATDRLANGAAGERTGRPAPDRPANGAAPGRPPSEGAIDEAAADRAGE
jgi:membrane protein DedA with SNARE-associated domain